MDFDVNKVNITSDSMSVYNLIHTYIGEREVYTSEPIRLFWKLNDIQQSQYIELMLLKVPMPPFYFDESNRNELVVIDGYFRLKAIQNFMVDKNFTLTHMECLKQYDGYGFDDLPKNISRRIEETDVVIHSIHSGTPSFVSSAIFSLLHI